MANLLREYLTRSGFSQADFAEYFNLAEPLDVDVQQTTVSKWLSRLDGGKGSKPAAKALKKLADLIGADVVELATAFETQSTINPPYPVTEGASGAASGAPSPLELEEESSISKKEGV